LFKFWALCVLEPLLGGVGPTYTIRLTLVGKRVVDFLLLLIKLFLLRITAEALRAKIDRKSALCKGWVNIRQFFS